MRSASARDAIRSSSRCSRINGSSRSTSRHDGESLRSQAVRDGRAARPLSSEVLGEHLFLAGCGISTTGASRASCGGAIGFPRTGATRCEDEPIVAEERPARLSDDAAATTCAQDEDVLDTWFSSGAVAVLDARLARTRPPTSQAYYPTSLLITGFDIIFFWVARMMMFGLKFIRMAPRRWDSAVPRRLHHAAGARSVRQEDDQVARQRGRSARNHGRSTAPTRCASRSRNLRVQGRDLILSDDRLAASRAFANKIWNAARFVMMNLEGAPQPLPPVAIAQAGPRRALDSEPARQRDSRSDRGDRRVRIQRRGDDRLPVHLARVL